MRRFMCSLAAFLMVGALTCLATTTAQAQAPAHRGRFLNSGNGRDYRPAGTYEVFHDRNQPAGWWARVRLNTGSVWVVIPHNQPGTNRMVSATLRIHGPDGKLRYLGDMVVDQHSPGTTYVRYRITRDVNPITGAQTPGVTGYVYGVFFRN